ncbi:proto-oncogene serine/threonine-protein kinase mos [Gastrophryne carolinensis]
MPSPIPVERFLPRDLSPSIDLRPCSSPLELSKPGGGEPRRPAASRLPPRLAWCRIDWEQVRLLEPLGSGGFGSVYRATYRGQTVALKKVKRCCKNRLASRQSFWAELNAARLRHPHVVRVLAASAFCPGDPGSPGTIIMEYAGNGSLHRRIYGRGPPLGTTCCLRYSGHIAEGLRFLHRGGVVHLDLKPANVLLAPGDICKIGDFGCSQLLRDGEDGGSTQLRHLGGTYTHRAPELLRGEPVTFKADIYSFAITLWQMVTRELPYTGDRQCILYAVVAHGLRPNIGQLFSCTEEGRMAKPVVESCWAARPDDRPSTEELLDTIVQLQDSCPEHSTAPGPFLCASLPLSPYPGRTEAHHVGLPQSPYPGLQQCPYTGLVESPYTRQPESPYPENAPCSELPQSLYPGQLSCLVKSSPMQQQSLQPGGVQSPSTGQTQTWASTHSLSTGQPQTWASTKSPSTVKSLTQASTQSPSTVQPLSRASTQSPSTVQPQFQASTQSLSTVQPLCLSGGLPPHLGLLQPPSPELSRCLSSDSTPPQQDTESDLMDHDLEWDSSYNSGDAPYRSSEQSTLARTCLSPCSGALE